jgi:rhamnogalacturonan endolyase
MHFIDRLATALALCGGVNASFGLTSTSSKYTVNTDGGLVFEVNRYVTNPANETLLNLERSNGDITSLKYNGVEYQGTGKASAINSGLGTSTVTGETVNGYVKITVKASGVPVTQYYVAKPKEPTIYMATYITGEVDPGELRWLARLRTSELPTGVHGNVGDTRGCTAFEGKDTFSCSNGQTRCKMYTSDRFIDDKVHCVSGSVS